MCKVFALFDYRMRGVQQGCSEVVAMRCDEMKAAQAEQQYM